MRLAKALFAPRAVALIGASGDARKNTARPQRFLRKHGYAGSTGLVSQSGTMLGTLLSRGAARGLGYAKLISVGNEADLGVAELVELLVEDADTRVIALFLETVRNAARLAAAARKAHAAGKPIVAYKLGRSALGEELARTHTGALAGMDAALDAYFRDCGIVRVDMLETLIEIPPLLNGRRPRGPAGAPRVAVVTTTGGGAASLVDQLGLHGIELASMHDLTMTATKDIYRATLEQLLGSPGCDAVLAAVGSSAQFHPELAVEPIVQATRTAKPLAAFLTPHAERSLALLAEQGVAAFRTPEACADAFAAFFAWRAPRQKMGTDPIISLGEKIGSVPNFELLAALGIPVAEHAVVQAPNFVHSIAYPVALKRLDVEHKTEVGGVVLNIQSGPELAEHARRMGQQRLLVQRMEHGLAEAIVGYRDDPVVGPLVLVGAGGTLA